MAEVAFFMSKRIAICRGVIFAGADEVVSKFLLSMQIIIRASGPANSQVPCALAIISGMAL